MAVKWSRPSIPEMRTLLSSLEAVAVAAREGVSAATNMDSIYEEMAIWRITLRVAERRGSQDRENASKAVEDMRSRRKPTQIRRR